MANLPRNEPEAQKKGTQLEDLPDEILSQIFRQFSAFEKLGELQFVNKRLHHVIWSSQSWANVHLVEICVAGKYDMSETALHELLVPFAEFCDDEPVDQTDELKSICRLLSLLTEVKTFRLEPVEESTAWTTVVNHCFGLLPNWASQKLRTIDVDAAHNWWEVESYVEQLNNLAPILHSINMDASGPLAVSSLTIPFKYWDKSNVTFFASFLREFLGCGCHFKAITIHEYDKLLQFSEGQRVDILNTFVQVLVDFLYLEVTPDEVEAESMLIQNVLTLINSVRPKSLKSLSLNLNHFQCQKFLNEIDGDKVENVSKLVLIIDDISFIRLKQIVEKLPNLTEFEVLADDCEIPDPDDAILAFLELIEMFLQKMRQNNVNCRVKFRMHYLPDLNRNKLFEAAKSKYLNDANLRVTQTFVPFFC